MDLSLTGELSGVWLSTAYAFSMIPTAIEKENSEVELLFFDFAQRLIKDIIIGREFK